MRLLSFVTAVAVILTLTTDERSAHAAANVQISGPHVHDNLAVYFVHGASASGPVPLTLDEALANGSVQVIETGEVNELRIENTGAEEVFIQSGDIVKGGKQDRVLTVSFILSAHSGQVPIASFCVERGRWTARGTEDASTFASATEALPSREAKLAMKAPLLAAPPVPDPSLEMEGSGRLASSSENEVFERQREVWDAVDKTQSKLSSGINAEVASPESTTSLQLAMENEKLRELRSAYVKGLQEAGEREDDIIGYAFAINGKLNSADLYASNGLFRKMWPKLLKAAATEAIGESNDKVEAPPSAEAVTAFLDEARRGKTKEQALSNHVRLETRESPNAIYFATEPESGGWVHENYLAK
jgi:hypothetical protein